LLTVARGAAVVGGAAGVTFSVFLPTVVEGLSIFYSLLGVTLLVPVVGGLFIARAGSREALASIAGGVVAWLAVRFWLRGISPWMDPTFVGLVVAALAFGLVLALPRRQQPA
jgi:SSS family solute:Na+ symporter